MGTSKFLFNMILLATHRILMRVVILMMNLDAFPMCAKMLGAIYIINIFIDTNVSILVVMSVFYSSLEFYTRCFILQPSSYHLSYSILVLHYFILYASLYILKYNMELWTLIILFILLAR